MFTTAYYHYCLGRIPGHTTREPTVGFKLETNGFQFYAIANLDKTFLSQLMSWLFWIYLLVILTISSLFVWLPWIYLLAILSISYLIFFCFEKDK